MTMEQGFWVVLLECLGCGRRQMRSEFDLGYDPTKLSDKEIMERFFSGWTAKDYAGAKATLCQLCIRNHQLAHIEHQEAAQASSLNAFLTLALDSAIKAKGKSGKETQ